jgi:CBS domain-containing protein
MAETPIEEAVKLMEEKRLLILPLERNGKMTHSVTRHELLRALIELGVGMGLEP